MFPSFKVKLEDGNCNFKDPLLTEKELSNLRPSPVFSKKALGFHVIILLSYSLLFLLALRASWSRSMSIPKSSTKYSPALESVEIISTLADIDAPSDFKGNPSKMVDDAWRDLLKGYNTRLSPSDIREMGQESILIADSSGDYWGITNSFHNLHCLKEIRQALAPEYYRINNTKHIAEGHVYAPHISHCIESLRHYIMCHADVTMLTWYWPKEEPQPGEKYIPQTNYTFSRQCANWTKLQDWTIEHSFQLSPETISHPKYGRIYYSNSTWKWLSLIWEGYPY